MCFPLEKYQICIQVKPIIHSVSCCSLNLHSTVPVIKSQYWGTIHDTPFGFLAISISEIKLSLNISQQIMSDKFINSTMYLMMVGLKKFGTVETIPLIPAYLWNCRWWILGPFKLKNINQSINPQLLQYTNILSWVNNFTNIKSNWSNVLLYLVFRK